MEYNLEFSLEKALDRHLYDKNNSAPLRLQEAIRYSVLSPGKRIRPRLLLACAEMLGLDASTVMPSALALEMIHCFTLIHDDLPCMDNDDYRRGILTNHRKFGEGIALLAGDGLLSMGIEVFLETTIEPKYLLQGLKRFLWAIGPRGVIGGQASEGTLGAGSTLKDLQKMHSLKTGALFTAALLIPKDFCGISDEGEQGAAICQFAHELGLAFQAADDLEDTEATPAKATSLLFYISKEEATRITLDNLERATARIHTIWSKNAQPLVEIANEVARKIKSA